MKRLFSAIFILFLLAAAGFAQDAGEAVWQFYKGNSNEFFAEFPSIPKTSRIADPKTKKEFGDLYKAYFNRTFYFVTACDSTDCPQFGIVKQLKFRARYAANAKLSEKTLDDSTIESSFTDAEGFHQKIRQIRTEKKYFILHTVSETANDPDAERFFQSFRLSPAIEDAMTADPEKYDKMLVSEASEIKLSPQTDIYDETPGIAKNELSLKKSTLTPVSILNKPPAAYSEAARHYEVSGQVVLRVTFVANKTIATVTPLRKLPFGLTDQAIAAVKEISFNPALDDGKAISVIKPIIYTFSIN
ncbi:MAG TPA: energy transducer TonB [Pyrinomonadaceae bacterium]|jgi:hypothetical protein